MTTQTHSEYSCVAALMLKLKTIPVTTEAYKDFYSKSIVR